FWRVGPWAMAREGIRKSEHASASRFHPEFIFDCMCRFFPLLRVQDAISPDWHNYMAAAQDTIPLLARAASAGAKLVIVTSQRNGRCNGPLNFLPRVKKAETGLRRGTRRTAEVEH